MMLSLSVRRLLTLPDPRHPGPLPLLQRFDPSVSTNGLVDQTWLIARYKLVYQAWTADNCIITVGKSNVYSGPVLIMCGVWCASDKVLTSKQQLFSLLRIKFQTANQSLSLLPVNTAQTKTLFRKNFEISYAFALCCRVYICPYDLGFAFVLFSNCIWVLWLSKHGVPALSGYISHKNQLTKNTCTCVSNRCWSSETQNLPRLGAAPGDIWPCRWRTHLVFFLILERNIFYGCIFYRLS